MLKRIQAIDSAIIERLQGVFDRIWDDHGIGVGHVLCGSAIVAGGLAFNWGDGWHQPTTVITAVILLVLGCLHTMVHASGHYEILNSVARMFRPLMPLRLFEVVMFPMGVVGVVYHGSDASVVSWGAYVVFLLYVMTVMVRARRPNVRRGTFAMARS